VGQHLVVDEPRELDRVHIFGIVDGEPATFRENELQESAVVLQIHQAQLTVLVAVDELRQIGLAIDVAIGCTAIDRAVARSEPAHPWVSVGVCRCERLEIDLGAVNRRIGRCLHESVCEVVLSALRDEELSGHVGELHRLWNDVGLFMTDLNATVGTDTRCLDLGCRFFCDATMCNLLAIQHRLLPVDVAKSAIAKAQQLEADSDHQEDAEQLPEGIEPSSSPLDFFANCRQSKVKTMFVERSNRQNTYRAITVAKRWPEFATTRTDGSGVSMTKADLQTALTAELGKEPHRQTVKRVWEKLVEIGGGDIVEKTRQVGRDQTQTEILAMDMDTAEGLLEKRYVGLDLLENSDHKATTGGVTPVVVESST